MPQADLDSTVKLRALAERLRRHASETELADFRRKFQDIAIELDEAAAIAEGLLADQFGRKSRR